MSGEPDARARAGGLVHLPVHERALGVARLRAELDHATLDHLVVQVVTLARALADAREHGETAVALRDVVDELHDENRLAHTCTTKQSNLSTLGVGLDQVNHLDSCEQDVG